MLGFWMMAALAAPVAAPTMDAQLRGDVRCMAIYAAGLDVLTKAEDKEIAGLGMIYYYARAEARLNPAQLAAAITQEAKILETTQGEAEGKRCDAEFKKVGERLVTLGDALGG